MADAQRDYPAIRMIVTLERLADPRLYDELIRIPPGRKRVNRLRNLALEGLLAQQWASRPAAPAVSMDGTHRAPGAPAPGVTNAVFDLPSEP